MRYIPVMATVAVLVAVYLVLRYLLPELMPFLLALVVAMLIDTPVSFLERRARLPRGWAVAGALAALLAGVGAVSWILASRLVFELGQLSQNINANLNLYTRDVQEMVAMVTRYVASYSAHIPASWDKVLQGELGRVSQLATALVSSLTGTVLALPGTVLMLAVAFVAAFFMSRDKDILQNFLLSFLPVSLRDRLLLVRSEIMASLARLLKAQFILVTVTALLTMVGLGIIGSPYAILLGLLAGLLDFLPYLGPSALFLPWIGYDLIFSHPAQGLELLALLVLLGVVRQLIEARVIGGQLGIHPLAILLALYLGVRLFGAWGFVLGPVSAVVLKAIYRSVELPWPRREEAKE